MNIGIFLVLLLLSGFVAAADYEIIEKQDSMRVESLSFASEHHRQVVRILTDEGTNYKEYLAVNSYIQIKNINVTVTSEGGRSTKLKKEQIVEVPVVESPEMVTDYKALVIVPENLRRGDTI